MPTEVWTALISGVVGLATGSVATAWANWGIEKRRLKVKRRYELLDSWRTGIASFDNFDDLKVIGPTPDWYETLRPHLSEITRTDRKAGKKSHGTPARIARSEGRDRWRNRPHRTRVRAKTLTDVGNAEVGPDRDAHTW